jgi:hypothetical protein
MAHGYIWGILISTFIMDYFRMHYMKEQSVGHKNEPVIDTPLYEGLKVKDGNNELKVEYDRPIYNSGVVNIKVQYW